MRVVVVGGGIVGASPYVGTVAADLAGGREPAVDLGSFRPDRIDRDAHRDAAR